MSENVVTLECDSFSKVTYVSDSLYVTTGQPITSTPTVTQSENVWTISLDCGREGSETTAEKFNQAITAGGQYHEFAGKGGGGVPDKLNFFFQVLIQIKVGSGPTTYDFITPVWLAQGHYLLTNNWWIGCNSIINVGKPVLLQLGYTSSPPYPLVEEMFTISGGTSSFKFKKL